MSVKHITSDNFEQDVLNSEKPVLADFWAAWCGPCKMLGPVIEELADELDDVEVVKVNVDENPDLMLQYKVRNIPTLILFEDGQAVDKMVGFAGKDEILEFLGK